MRWIYIETKLDGSSVILLWSLLANLKGKVAWVTGASSGIGEALCYQLAQKVRTLYQGIFSEFLSSSSPLSACSTPMNSPWRGARFLITCKEADPG